MMYLFAVWLHLLPFTRSEHVYCAINQQQVKLIALGAIATEWGYMYV